MKLDPRRSRHCPIGVIALVLALAAVPAAVARDVAEDAVVPYQPAKSASATLSMLQAARLAVEHDPAIYLARQDTLRKSGIARQSMGSFDPTLVVDASLDLAQSELTSGGRGSAEGNRLVFWATQDVLDTVAFDLRAELARQDAELGRGSGLAYADCSEYPGGQDIVLPGGRPVCISGREQANEEAWRAYLDALTDPTDPTNPYNALRDALITTSRSEIENSIDVMIAVAQQLRAGLRRLGTLPELDERIELSLDFKYSKPFRSGVVITPEIMLTATRDNYAAKPMNPAYGGKGVPDSFQSILGVTIDIPLGKGRGVKSTGAAERSARLNYEASIATQAHAISGSVLSALQAYWALVAAQESLALVEESARRQDDLAELAGALVDAEELAPAELDRVQARVATARAAVAQARQSVLSARLGLADVIGFEVDAADQAPLASDSLPPIPEAETVRAWDLANLLHVAKSNRADLRAALKFKDSAAVLSEASRRDLKRKTDLQVVLAYSAQHEGESPLDPMDWAMAVENVFFGGLTGPSGQINLNVDWPFKNNAAHGRYAQARASEHQSQISARNLERVIAANVESVLGAMVKAVEEIDRQEESVQYYQETLEAEMEKFKVGESTAIDVILTEEQEINARISLVGAKQAYANLLAELRYELGTLLTYKRDEAKVVVEEVHPVGFEFAVRPAA